MTSRVAQALVFVTSGLVLVIEIVAGRIVAPYVGISLETFTGIIGTMLAGIAAGAAVGGTMADRQDPTRLIGPAVAVGGVLTWLSLPIARFVGPALGSSPAEAVVLVAAAFFLPAAVLSSVSPMIAKLALRSTDETGTVVGGLSAAGTAGALVGTFVAGFVLIGLFGNRAIIAGTGAVLVVLGLALMWWLARERPGIEGVGAAAVALVALVASGGICDHETTYYCVRIQTDAADSDRRSLWLDQLRHGFVDLNDPTNHDIRYVRILADVVDGLEAGGVDALHIGGGAFSLPGHIAETRPGSSQVVLEIDPELVDIARAELGLVTGPELVVRVGDGRLALADLPTDGVDVVVGDAFGSEAVPWHLTTDEVAEELARILRPSGVYAMNILDGPDARFAAAQLATLGRHFDHLAIVQPPADQADRRFVNRILVAGNRPIGTIDVDPGDGTFVLGDPYRDGRILTDDHAPVDQLIG